MSFPYQNRVDMLKNYFKTAWRSLRSHKTATAINIAGLSAGMAVTILIGLWIWDEVSFDKSNPHYDRIAQVLGNATMNGSVNTFPTQPVPEADVLRQDYGSDFKYISMASHNGDHVLAAGEKIGRASCRERV